MQWGPTNRSKANEMPVVHVPSEHILFTDNECRAGGGITIGSEGSGNVTNGERQARQSTDTAAQQNIRRFLF